MDNGSLDGGSGNVGFHSYRRSPRPISTPAPSSATETSMGLPARLNQAITECIIREQDRFMPIANVVRIMRRILPSHAKISDDSKQLIQECVSEFISFITMEANDRCKHEQRKTITAEDILWAMSKIGLDDYIEPLTLYLQRFREFDYCEGGSMSGEPLPFKHPMAHHHGYFVHPPGNARTSQSAVAAVNSEVESPAEEGKE